MTNHYWTPGRGPRWIPWCYYLVTSFHALYCLALFLDPEWREPMQRVHKLMNAGFIHLARPREKRKFWKTVLHLLKFACTSTKATKYQTEQVDKKKLGCAAFLRGCEVVWKLSLFERFFTFSATKFQPLDQKYFSNPPSNSEYQDGSRKYRT